MQETSKLRRIALLLFFFIQYDTIINNYGVCRKIHITGCCPRKTAAMISKERQAIKDEDIFPDGYWERSGVKSGLCNIPLRVRWEISRISLSWRMAWAVATPATLLPSIRSSRSQRIIHSCGRWCAWGRCSRRKRDPFGCQSGKDDDRGSVGRGKVVTDQPFAAFELYCRFQGAVISVNRTVGSSRNSRRGRSQSCTMIIMCSCMRN